MIMMYDILKKEFYLAKHSAILVFKKLGQPTSVVGLYLPLIEEYEDIFPSETRQIFKREKQQQQNRAKGAAGDRQAQQLADQEDYLQFPKYYCCESGLYMFFNPKKGQWKIIGTPIMHQPHAVKACSETGVKVMFPPLAPWQQHFEPMIQFPALDGTLIDKQLLKQGVQPFVDPEFPPNRKSLAERGASSGQVVQGEVEWFRARDIHDTDFPMKLYDRIEPSDCIQGGLGDCWLLAALAVVAEYPDFVPTQCFHEKECQMNGKYRINLFDYSKSPPAWRTITIDDFIPCYPKSPFAETPIPRFSQPNGNEAWFLLLEKAFAKFAGGYMNLKAGYAGLAWIALTGCLDYGRWIREKDERNPPPVGGPKDVGKATEQSVKQVKFRRRPIASFHPSGNRLGFEYTDYQASDVVYAGEAMIGYLRQCERNNYPVCAVGVHGTGMEHKRDDGLIDGHAYSVLQILDVNCLDGKTRTLVKLRNPWGDFHEWEGPFGDDHAASWKLVADNGKGIRNTELDGIFWMEAPAFLSYFTHVEAVHYDLKRRKPGPPMAGLGAGGVAAGMIAGTGGTVVNRGLDPKQAQRRDNWQKERAQDDRTLSMKFHKPGSGANKAPEGKRKAAKSKDGNMLRAVACSGRPIFSSIGAGFSTRQFSSSAVKKLETGLAQELQHEKENYEKPPELSKVPAGWTLVDEPGSVNMKLEKTLADGMRVCRIEWQLVSPSMGYNDDVDGGADAEGETPEEPSEVELSITVENKEATEGLTYYCSVTSMDGAKDGPKTSLSIGNVKTWNTTQEKENPAAYNGPEFDDLDDRLQEAMEEYLTEIGVNEEVQVFVNACAADKEQREYVRWIENLTKFVKA
eukprot:g16488.t1